MLSWVVVDWPARKDSSAGVLLVIVNGAESAPSTVAVIEISPDAALKWVPVLVTEICAPDVDDNVTFASD